MSKETRYYSDFSDDFSETKTQDFKIRDDYKWVRNSFFAKLFSGVVYAAAIAFGCVFCPLVLRMKSPHGASKMRKTKEGFFIYGNHTQPVGDVVIPALCAFPKRIYTVVSQANYGIPVIGRLLPYLGALPISDTFEGMREFNRAVEYRLSQKRPIVIYPEAHVWEYYTGIRPFPDTSFKFPVYHEKPSYAMTATYRKTRFFKRPVMNVYIDGPFFPHGKNKREKAENLKNDIYGAMLKRSKLSDCEYIAYRKKDE